MGRVRAVMQHSLVRGVGGGVGSCRGARAGIAVPAGKVTRGNVQADPVAYPQHVARMLKLLGEDETRSSAAGAAVLRFETALAQSSRTLEALRDPYANYNKLSTPSPEELAHRTGCNARLIREWLSAHAAAGYMEHAEGQFIAIV